MVQAMLSATFMALMLAMGGYSLEFGQPRGQGRLTSGHTHAQPGGVEALSGRDGTTPLTAQAHASRMATALNPVNWSAFPPGHVHIQPNSEWSNVSVAHGIFRRQYVRRLLLALCWKFARAQSHFSEVC